MSRFHRAVEKAEREGLMTWTTGADSGPAVGVVESPPPPIGEPIVAPPPQRPVASPIVDRVEAPSQGWDAPTALSPLFVAANEPGSPAAEQYRLLRTRLEGEEGGRRAQLLLVTSAAGRRRQDDNQRQPCADDGAGVSAHRSCSSRPTSGGRRLASLFGARGTNPASSTSCSVRRRSTTRWSKFLVSTCTSCRRAQAAARSTELLASSMMERVIDRLRARFDRDRPRHPADDTMQTRTCSPGSRTAF